MTHLIPLDSEWTLHPVRLAEGAPELPAQITASVPGTVHTDLLAAGLIADPYLDLNEQKDAWIGHSDWVYRTVIRDVPSGDRLALAFDGLDTVATVFLDGDEVGRTINQHRSYRFDVTGRVREGSVVEVRFDDVWAYAEALRDELGERPNEYPTPGNFVRKMAANFGWDWGPQLVTAGIWREARIEGWSRARLDEVVTQVTVDADGAGRVQVSTRVDSDGESDARTVRIAVAGVSADAPVASDGTARIELRVPGVERWWPRGMGGQRRYDVTITLDEDGSTVDTRTRRVGFRSVELDTSADEHGTGFTFVINGIRTVIRGANWIPEDCFPSRVTRDRYRARLQDAVDANLNLIRVWGGGIYESFHFYDLCDEMGLLTWQDFLFACAAYPEEEPLRSEVEAEARENVARLSGHPSLVLFNGANENIEGWHDWGWQQKLEGRTWGLGYYTEMLPGIVSEVAPWTPYWANSPYSGTLDIHPNDPAHGTKHIWDVWNRVDYTGYAAYVPRFAAEYGFQGPPTWSTLTRAIHDEPLTPQSPGMLLHQKAADGMAKIRRGMAPHFPEPVGIEEWHYLAQLNQARAIVFGTGFWRAQRPVCMGTVVWQLNDCWPVTSWAAVDGDGRRKPLWHALRRVNAERLAVIAETDGVLTLHLVNDGVADWNVRGRLERSSFTGEVHAEEPIALTVPALSSTTVPLATELVDPVAPTAEILVATLSGVLDGRPLVHTFAEDKSLALEDVEVRVVVGEWQKGAHPVTLTADSLVRGASLFPDRVRSDAWVSDLDLDLLAGESVTVTVHTPVPLEASALASTLRTLNPLVARMG
ncbi:MAG: glycosyl hydrolase 2 galactose-binding domain-containing protein [Actinomycetota bacterium]